MFGDLFLKEIIMKGLFLLIAGHPSCKKDFKILLKEINYSFCFDG
jgi:hypothetical protein